MKRQVILSVNENPKYLYYLPLVIWAWKQFGWDVIVFNTGNNDTSPKGLATHGLMVKTIPKEYDLNNIYFTKVEGYKSETVAQVSRLYATCIDKFNGGDYFMTSDSDMLPLSDYWHFTHPGFTTWGRDLTDYHYPICYVGAGCNEWEKIMNVTRFDYHEMIERDLNYFYPRAKNKWCTDQDIITERLLTYGKDKITHINRGTDKRTGYPLGRVDRSNWHMNHTQLIDAHLPHDILTNDESFHKVLNLLHHCWPKEDFKWYIEYHREFKKLL